MRNDKHAVCRSAAGVVGLKLRGYDRYRNLLSSQSGHPFSLRLDRVGSGDRRCIWAARVYRAVLRSDNPAAAGAGCFPQGGCAPKSAEFWRACGLVPGVRPAGHLPASRCGSTLVAQMLAGCPENIVALGTGDSSGCAGTEQARIRCGCCGGLSLRWPQPRRGGERQCFLRLTSRSILEFPLLRRWRFRMSPWV